MEINLDDVVCGYLDCAAWSSGHDWCVFESDTIKTAHDVCRSFIVYAICTIGPDAFDGLTSGDIGHNFWLTRNGHGAGFWDRGIKHGDALTVAAKAYGEAYVLPLPEDINEDEECPVLSIWS